jgi:hypothetical protein
MTLFDLLERLGRLPAAKGGQRQSAPAQPKAPAAPREAPQPSSRGSAPATDRTGGAPVPARWPKPFALAA